MRHRALLTLLPLQTALVPSKTMHGIVYWSYSVLKGLNLTVKPVLKDKPQLEYNCNHNLQVTSRTN